MKWLQTSCRFVIFTMTEARYVWHSSLRQIMRFSRFYAAPQNSRLAKPAVSLNSIADPLLYCDGHNKDTGRVQLLSEKVECSTVLVNVSLWYLAQHVESTSFCSTCVIHDVISGGVSRVHLIFHKPIALTKCYIYLNGMKRLCFYALSP